MSMVRRASTYCGYHLSLQVGPGNVSPQDMEGSIGDKGSVCLSVGWTPCGEQADMFVGEAPFGIAPPP